MVNITVYTERMLKFLEEHNVHSVEELVQLSGEQYPIDSSPDYIVVAETKCERTQGYRISYVVPDDGVPLELSFKPQTGKTRLIIKSQITPKGYEWFFTDKSGKTRQTKTVDTLDFNVLKQELEQLRESNSS